MTIILRSVKGSNLTAAEVDGNFTDLDDRVTELEDNPPEPVGIANVVVTGATFIVVLTDATELGPFVIPVATPRPTITEEITAATLTPSLAQSSHYFRCTHASGCDVTIPTNGTIPHIVDTELHFRQCAAESTDSDNAITFFEGGDTDETVIINLPVGKLPQTAYQGAVVTLKKVAENEWDAFGALADDV